MTAGGEDSVAEHVRAEYVSTHSYLDAILSRINTAEVDMDTMMIYDDDDDDDDDEGRWTSRPLSSPSWASC